MAVPTAGGAALFPGSHDLLVSPSLKRRRAAADQTSVAAIMGSDPTPRSARLLEAPAPTPCGPLTRTELIALLATVAMVVAGVLLLTLTASNVAHSI